MMFTGFPEATIQFFLDIRFHNSIDYFEENRARYERDVKAPFEAFIQELAPAMLSIDPQMELRPYRCMARLRRDVRFTKDKSPFRDHLWVLFRHAGEPREGSVMYWFELAPSGMNWGVGTWGENRQMMDILRRNCRRPGRSAERHQAVSPDGASHARRRQLLQAAGSAGGCA